MESVAARICREAGGRVTTNVMVRDMDLARPDVHDTRRLEVVVDGLSLFGGVQLAADTTVVSALHANGDAQRNAARRDGVALEAARWRKERTYPELNARGERARLVVLGVKVDGRWSTETRSFLSQLAHGRARSERLLMRKRVEQAWRLRWGSLLSCAVALAVAMSLLDLPGSRGADGICPLPHDVERDFRLAGLDAG